MVRDMTTGSPLKAITFFAVPMFIGTVFQQIYNMADSIVVGRFVSADALGAVGACGGTFNLILALLVGLTGGSGVILAQYFGAKNENMLRRAFASSVLVNILAGVLLTIVGVLLAKPLVLLLGTPDAQVNDAIIYLTYMSAGILANCLYNGMSSVLRALGDSIVPLLVLVVASLLNIVLDILFVVNFHWGVAGVALATVLAQLISAVACIIYTFIKLPQLKFKKSDLVGNKGIITEIIRIGVPSALTSSGVSISVMFMQRAINGFGETVVTGYTIGNKAEQIGMCLAIAIGMSVGTFCGQNIGAKKFDRVRQGIRIGVIVSIVYTVLVAGLMILFGQYICRLFTEDQEALKIALEVMYVTMPFAPVLGLIFVFREFLKSAGDVAPTVIMSLTEIFGRSVLAFVFAGIWGYTGIWWVTPIGWIASLIIGIIRYRSGIWKTKGAQQ